MKAKIVSHCYVPSSYDTPDGYSGDYNQIQVVLSDGSIWALVSYWKDRGDAHTTQEWREVKIPPFKKPRRKVK